MDELNKTAATEPETRPEAAKLQDAPRRRVGSLTLGACLIAAGIFFLCYYFVPGFDWRLVVRCWDVRYCSSPPGRADGSMILSRCWSVWGSSQFVCA